MIAQLSQMVIALGRVGLALGALLAIVLGLNAQEKVQPPLVREIFIPFDDLNVLLENAPQHVFLGREEYEALLAQAVEGPLNTAPVSTAILHADYQVMITEGRAGIAADLTIEVLNDGIHAVPIPSSGVGLKSVTIDEQNAAVGRSPEGHFVLFVSGRGTHRVHLELTALVQTSAAQQVLQVHLPTAATSHMHVRVPGNVELKSGAHVVSREIHEQQQETRFVLLPPQGPLTLVMSLNNRILQRDRVMVARSVVLDEIAEGVERVHVTTTFSILHGAADRLEFRLPADFEIEHVDAETLARWSSAPDADGQQKLSIELRQPATEPVTVTFVAVRFARDNTNWAFPAVTPLEVEGQVSVVGLLLEQGWRVQHVATEGLIPIDREVLARTLTSEILNRNAGAPPIRPVLAFYAPQADYRWTAEFEKPSQRLEVVTSLLLHIDETGQEVSGAFSLRPKIDRLFQVTFQMPAGWTLVSLRDMSGNALQFETYAREGGGQQVAVRLPSVVAANDSFTLAFTARGNIEGWLEDWKERTFEFPVFQVEGADQDHGAIAILAFDDLEVRPEQLNQLSPLNNDEKEQYGLQQQTDLAFRYDAHPFSATFHVRRREPNLTAQSFSFLKVGKDGLEANYETIFSIREASTRRLRVSLPAETPSEVSISGYAGTIVKEYTSSIEDGQRVWLILLADQVALNAERIGAAHIALSFQQPLPEEPRDLPLPIIRPVGVQYQTGVIAIEGDAELEVDVNTDARKTSLSDLAGSQRQPGRRLLGTFAYAGDVPSITVDVFRREAHGLPQAIAEKAELWTAVATSGQGQTLARFHLRTKALLLEARLPPNADLWSVWLDDQAITPQRDGDAVLINLPASSQRAVRVLDIAYGVPLQRVDLWGSLETSAPRLYLPAIENEGQAAEIPVTDLNWQLLLPKGYRLTDTDGTVHWKQPPARRRLRDILAEYNPFQAFATGPKSGEVASLDEMDPAGTTTTSELLRGSSPAPGHDMMKMMSESPAEPTAAPTQLAAVTESGQVPQDEAEGVFRNDDLPVEKGLQQRSAALADLTGVRSLRVDLQKAFHDARPEQVVQLQSLGQQPRLSVRLIHESRWRFAEWAVGLSVFLFGTWSMRRGARSFLQFMIVTVVFVLLVPTAALFALHDLALAAALALIALVPVALVVGLYRWSRSRLRRTLPPVTSAAAVLLLFFLGADVWGQQAPDIRSLLEQLAPITPVTLPPDAIVIPYEPAPGRDPRVDAQRILVPYPKYIELWNRAHPDQPLMAVRSPVEYALAGAKYSTTLVAEDVIEVRGEIEIEVFVDRAIAIPLSLQGGVITQALLDGAAARVQLTSAATDQAAQANAPLATGSLVIYAEGRGRKKLELTLQFRVERSGGWRLVTAQLPAGPAGTLTITVPDANTEVRLQGVHDRSQFETAAANERIETALPLDAPLSIQWRPKVTEGQVDRSLTVQSTAVLDVQEDGLRVAWQAQLQFRRGRREDFTFLLPDDFLVQRVLGENVRGWTSEATESGQRVSVTLLRPATDQETLSIYLSKRLPIAGQQPVTVAAPSVQVVDAALHHGSLTVRRSPLIELRSTKLDQVTRTDVDAGTAESLMTAAGQEQRPLPVQPFQAFQFASVPFTVEFEAQSISPALAATLRTILRVAERELLLETQCELSVQRAPLHVVRILLPSTFEVDQVSEQEWVVTDEANGRVLTVYLPEGRMGSFAVHVAGSLGQRAAADPVDVPKIQVLDAQRHEGQIVVQVDPAYRVRAEQLQNAEVVPLERSATWLQEQQRDLARHGLVLGFRTADYSGRLTLARRDPVVRCTTLTNLHVTPRSIQETIMIEFRVLEAGIQRLQFQLPARMADARMRVPALRQKTITPVENGEQPMVRVQLDLQDELMDVIRVVIERDEALTSEPHAAPIPLIETGEVEAQYVTLQNSSRDEVVTVEKRAIEELTRQQTRWRALAALDVTQGYVVQRDQEHPQLIYQTKPREAVETVGARIGLSETVLVVDVSGAYRAVQTLRVENTTEQFLEIQLPAGAALWTAQVAGEPVKPTVADESDQNSIIRIPLVKTEAGDADYPVALVYAGRLQAIRVMSKVRFPLIRTVNVHIERSQMTLYLPESHRWFDFRGASQLASEYEYAAGFRTYFGEQVERITKVTESGTSYDRARAYRNLTQLESQLQGQAAQQQLPVQAYAEDAKRILDEAKKQVVEQELATQGEAIVDNRSQLNRYYSEQNNSRSRNVVKGIGNNFSYDAGDALGDQQPTGGKDVATRFNEEWLEQNRLSQVETPHLDAMQRELTNSPAKPATDDELRELNRQVQQQYAATRDASSPQIAVPPDVSDTQLADGTSRLPSSNDLAGRRGSEIASSDYFQQAPASGPAGISGSGAGGGMMGGNAASIPMNADEDAAAVEGGEFADAGLASLFIEIPKRGQVFYFQSPRGQVDLSAQAVASTFVERVARVVAAFVIGAVLLFAIRPRRRR